MANNTPNLKISHIATNQNQKEVTANTSADELDLALTSLLAKALPDSNYTLTASEGGEAYGNIAFNFTGALTADRNVIVPTTPKLYIAQNSTTGGHNITVKTVGGTGIAVTPASGYAILYCDGVNVVQLTNAGGGSGLQATSQKDQANGYAGLDANTFLKAAEANRPLDARTTVTEAVTDSDRGKLVTFSNGSAVAASIAQAGTGGLFAAGWFAYLFNVGAGVVTLTPATSTVNGSATITFVQYTGCFIYSDGTNYGALRFGIVPTTATTHQFVTAIAADGTGTKAQPAAADLSDGVTGTGAVVEAVAPTVTTPKWTAYTVAGLPGGSEGQYAYATDGLKVGELTGAGTGVPVYFSNGSWRVFSTDAAVAS